MSGAGYTLTVGRCWSCGALFSFNPHLVPSVPIDPETNRPPDLGGSYEQAIRQPLCAGCISVANAHRQANGQPPIQVLPGAYELEGPLP